MHQLEMIKNFMFHRVNPVRDKLWDPMDVRLFEHTVKHLSRNFEVVLLEDICNAERPYNKRSRTFATISFDDGYRDNLEYAAPILEKYGCRGSFYVVTDCVDSGKMTWTQELKHYLQTTTLLRFDCDQSYLPEKLRVERWKNKTERLFYAQRIRNFLLKSNQRVRNLYLDTMRATLHDVAPMDVMLNWDEVRQLKKAGHVIGSHTKTHPALPTLENDAEFHAELYESGRRIEEELGEFPVSISYPFGAYDSNVIRAAKQAGYRLGITVDQQWHYYGVEAQFAISRTGLVNELWPKTLSRINGSFEEIRRLITGRNHHWRPGLMVGNIILSSSYLATEVLETLA